MLPHSEACERNKEPILEHLRHHFKDVKNVLEIGSGTAQHAVHFSTYLPHLIWQTSDRQEYIPGIEQRLTVEGNENLLFPLELDVANQEWQVDDVDGIFSANTLHIMSERNVEQFFSGCGRILKPQGLLVVYGPFKYDGSFTSESNGHFDAHLKNQAEHMGIRDFEWVDGLAKTQGMQLLNDYSLPANNQLLVWKKHQV